MKNNEFVKIREESSDFYIHARDSSLIPSKSMNVFYNKKMILNRDITNLAISAYKNLYNQNDLIIVDSMAASGISSIRILNECKDVKKIYINDINSRAIELIKKNLKLNNLDKISSEVEISKKDANFLFLEITQKRFLSTNNQEVPNIISIDPFGAPNLYIDSAFKAIKNNHGLICITATDTAVLFGIKINACIRKYLAKPLHTEYCKEIGSRILTYFISRIANINKMGIIPLLTFYSGHFIRVFCLLFKNKRKITQSFKNYGYILHCNNCGYRFSFRDKILKIPRECPLCYNKESLDYAGPLWIDKIHDINFLNEILGLNKTSKFLNKKRIEKLLNFAIEEIDLPISYYNIHKLCQNLKLPSVPKIEDIISRIEEIGYLCSRTHFDFLSIKSDLDLPAIKNILVELQK